WLCSGRRKSAKAHPEGMSVSNRPVCLFDVAFIRCNKTCKGTKNSRVAFGLCTSSVYLCIDKIDTDDASTVGIYIGRRSDPPFCSGCSPMPCDTTHLEYDDSEIGG